MYLENKQSQEATDHPLGEGAIRTASDKDTEKFGCRVLGFQFHWQECFLSFTLDSINIA